jgi:hypothetical protein
MKQSEIEYLVIEAKKCQGLVKELDSDFEFEGYAKNNFFCKKTDGPVEKEYGRIIDVAERKTASGYDLKDYDTLSDLIMKYTLKSKNRLEASVDASRIISSLEEMKEIAGYYAGKKEEYRKEEAVTASKYISKVISEAKKCAGGVFHENTYSGTLSIEAIAADLFKGKIYDESKIEDEVEKIENLQYHKETGKFSAEKYVGNNIELGEPKKSRRNSRKEEDDRDSPYKGVYEILEDSSRRLSAESKKMDGNIFEKIFYTIFYGLF